MERKEDQLIALRTGAKPAERSGEYWSKADIQLLKQLYYGGIGLSEIALQLGRSEVAVCQQLMKMGLLSAQGKPRIRRPKEPRPQCFCPVCLVNDCENCGRECSHAGTV